MGRVLPIAPAAVPSLGEVGTDPARASSLPTARDVFRNAAHNVEVAG